MTTTLTKHGELRVTQRSAREDANLYADRAYRNGKKPETFTYSKFVAYLNKVASRSVAGAQLRIFNNQIFVFSPDNELITVLNVPSIYTNKKFKINYPAPKRT